MTTRRMENENVLKERERIERKNKVTEKKEEPQKTHPVDISVFNENDTRH